MAEKDYGVGDWNMSEEPTFLAQPIKVLGLSTRLLWALSGQLNSSAYKSPLPPEAATVGELIDKSSVELMRIPNIGAVSVREIREALARRGLYLRDERPTRRDLARLQGRRRPPSERNRVVELDSYLQLHIAAGEVELSERGGAEANTMLAEGESDIEFHIAAQDDLDQKPITGCKIELWSFHVRNLATERAFGARLGVVLSWEQARTLHRYLGFLVSEAAHD